MIWALEIQAQTNFSFLLVFGLGISFTIVKEKYHMGNEPMALHMLGTHSATFSITRY